ncbi:Yippee domain-containing protein [Caenorhabditis elegans]|uniref:Yippee domain-containing protein n=3 Tax=Caenorhabditis elegans TaxID=6239 RepID=U4PBQ7_CAEEL|nr:Yippee domain-containing protein [Caenorhabditis elegans]CDH93300.1 Yippee domain-containing protein [Caenorhabditis elegans]|eukprot:NP_001294508.1 Uncharacterized protein CELE_B0546.3 [Caenorhabditis elegans]
MGLKFFENAGGLKMFFCTNCDTYLADKGHLVSTSFTGTTGQAFLFKNVTNVKFGESVVRNMLTGAHFVRDVFCQSCRAQLGWMYELAPNDNEKYKEGSVILERMNITEREAFSKISQMNGNLQPDALRREMEDAEDRNHHVMRRRMFEAMRMANFEDRVHPRFRRQGEPNYFNRFADGAMPAVRFSDFERLRERTLMAEDTAAIIWETLQRFNLAIVASIQGNNESLLEMGFTRELGHQYPGIRLLMEGHPYDANPGTDRMLAEMFNRMTRELEHGALFEAEMFDEDDEPDEEHNEDPDHEFFPLQDLAIRQIMANHMGAPVPVLQMAPGVGVRFPQLPAQFQPQFGGRVQAHLFPQPGFVQFENLEHIIGEEHHAEYQQLREDYRQAHVDLIGPELEQRRQEILDRMREIYNMRRPYPNDPVRFGA